MRYIKTYNESLINDPRNRYLSEQIMLDDKLVCDILYHDSNTHLPKSDDIRYLCIINNKLLEIYGDVCKYDGKDVLLFDETSCIVSIQKKAPNNRPKIDSLLSNYLDNHIAVEYIQYIDFLLETSDFSYISMSSLSYTITNGDNILVYKSGNMYLNDKELLITKSYKHMFIEKISFYNRRYRYLEKLNKDIELKLIKYLSSLCNKTTHEVVERIHEFEIINTGEVNFNKLEQLLEFYDITDIDTHIKNINILLKK